MRKLTLSLAVMAALLPFHGYPLGLGELELNSALNQELNAEIKVLSAASEDAEQIIIKLASREAFSRAGLDRPYLLQQLKFKIVDKNGVPYVKVYTKTPIREPFLSFLLEIDWPKGHLLREYTLLLDPPVYNAGGAAAPAPSASAHPFIDPADSQAQAQPVYSEQQSAQAVQGSAKAAPYGQTAQNGSISSDSGRSVNYQYQAMPQANPSIDQYRVQKNDTLWSIANRTRPDSSVSVEQMMLALLRRNPEAFIQENINGVKRGYILRMPSRDEATRIDRQQAVAQAREHAALWREYSQGATRAAPASSMETEAPQGGAAADQLRDAEGHLSIVSASDHGSEHSGSNQDPDAMLSNLQQDLDMAREQLESERLEKEDLRARLAELEQRVQRVIEMDDGELAKLQQDLSKTQQAAETIEAPLIEEMPAETQVEEPIVDEIVSDEMPVEEGMVEDAPAENMAEEPIEDALFIDETNPETVADDMAEVVSTEVEMPSQHSEPVETVEPPAFAQKKPAGFLASLMDDPKLLGMIGGGLAFILLLIALLLKRLRGDRAEADEEWAAAIDDEAPYDLGDIDPDLNTETVQTNATGMDSTSEMMAESLGEELEEDITRLKEVEPVEDNLQDTAFNLQATETEADSKEEEKDDVIAEADVYLAYGIYQQAEELLNSAIDQNPERDDYRMKLLETHFAAKNASGFEQLARDVQIRKGDDKTYWNRVASMGMELCPDSSLFSAADAGMAAAIDLPDKPQTTDLELDAGDDQTSDMDLSLETSDDLSADFDLSLETSDDLSADFDLSLDAAEEPLSDDSLSDELDLAGDLDDIASEISSEIEEPGDEAATEVIAESADLDIDDDFSLDFDASDLGFEESEEAAMDADDSIELDLSSDIELGGDEIDLGDMDMGLDESAEVTDIGVGTSADMSGDDSEFDISELSEDIDEVNTKLDLAKAYIDMGDSDGARSILEEVKSEGNNEQQQQAEALLQKAS